MDFAKIKAIIKCAFDGHIAAKTAARCYCLRCGRNLPSTYKHEPSKRKQEQTQWQR